MRLLLDSIVKVSLRDTASRWFDHKEGLAVFHGLAVLQEDLHDLP